MSYNNAPGGGDGRGANAISNINSGPRAKCDQVMLECLSKSLEIVVAARGHPTPIGHHHGITTTTTSRFNLSLPENSHVRNMTSRWKGALHVPLRLDVYVEQHDADDEHHRRDLLERWCWHYAPGTLERFHMAEGSMMNGRDNNEMVQLRHVCKRTVVWLRVLYSWCRLLLPNHEHLPRQRLGFAIYAAEQHEHETLPGFTPHIHPSAIVTPYGELKLSVWQAPEDFIRQFVVPRQKTSFANVAVSSTRPIPILKKQPSSIIGDDDSYTDVLPQPAAARTAPAQFALEQNRHHHYHPAAEPAMMSKTPGPYLAPGNNNTNLGEPIAYRRSKSTIGGPSTAHRDSDHGGGDETFVAPPLQRRNTERLDHAGHVIDQKPPERIMSGLSLALMMNDDGNDDDDGDVAKNAGKRRSALHHAPPPQYYEGTGAAAAAHHASPQLRPSWSNQHEYGYGYNNHIPWQRIHPSSNNPTEYGRSLDNNNHATTTTITTKTVAALSSSPKSFVGTPPTTPRHQPAFAALTSPPSHFKAASLMPPRSRTPPYVPRTLPPEASFLPPPMVQALPQSAAAATEQQKPLSTQHLHVLPPTTALDLLHSSPFHITPSQQSLFMSGGGGAVAAIGAGAHHDGSSGGGGSYYGNSSTLWGSNPAFTASSFLPTLSSSSPLRRRNSSFSKGDDDDDNDMPFAVDADDDAFQSHAAPGGTTGASSSSTLLGAHSSSSAAVVASFATKCQNSHRLSLFDSVNTNDDQRMTELALQLADLKSFGQSLHVESSAATSAHHSDGSGSATTGPQNVVSIS